VVRGQVGTGETASEDWQTAWLEQINWHLVTEFKWLQASSTV